MGVGEGVEDLGEEPAGRRPTGEGHVIAQRPSIGQLHDDVGMAGVEPAVGVGRRTVCETSVFEEVDHAGSEELPDGGQYQQETSSMWVSSRTSQVPSRSSDVWLPDPSYVATKASSSDESPGCALDRDDSGHGWPETQSNVGGGVWVGRERLIRLGGCPVLPRRRSARTRGGVSFRTGCVRSRRVERGGSEPCRTRGVFEWQRRGLALICASRRQTCRRRRDSTIRRHQLRCYRPCMDGLRRRR